MRQGPQVGAGRGFGVRLAHSPDHTSRGSAGPAGAGALGCPVTCTARSKDPAKYTTASLSPLEG